MNAAHPMAHAVATVVVTRSEAKPYDDDSNPQLLEIALTETFTGDIEANSEVRALQARRTDRSASMTSLQRVRGMLGGRRGSFVLQGSETIQDGRIKATWFVVPGSGTGDLQGLCGDGGFEGEFGRSSRASLDYWFA